MGREIKRVPPDFDWPLNKVWEGYLNPLPYGDECEHCQGTGLSEHAYFFDRQWYGKEPFNPYETGSVPFTADSKPIIDFVKRQVERNPEFYTDRVEWYTGYMVDLHNSYWSSHLSQADVDVLVVDQRLNDLFVDGRPPTPAEVNAWSVIGRGHDAINNMLCVRARCERLGVSHECSHCQGQGVIWESPEQREAYEAWVPQEPPEGEGWQIWENVSEGSPVSAVFATADALIQWLIEDQGIPLEVARSFVDDGYAPSFVVQDGQLQSGMGMFRPNG